MPNTALGIFNKQHLEGQGLALDDELAKVNKEIYERNVELAIKNRTLQLIRQMYEIMNSTYDAEETARKFDCDIYLYGSLSRGEDVENSDVDLLVIGEANEPDIVKEIKSKINRETKIQIFSRMEWSQLERRDRAFYERVERDKIKLN